MSTDKAQLLFNQALELHDRADESADDAEALLLLRAACAKFTQVVRARRTFRNAHLKWGLALGAIAARTQDSAQKMRFLLEAERQFKQATDIDPNDSDACANLANTLCDLADQTGRSEIREQLYERAYGWYARSVEITPDDSETYYNWATSLMGHSKRSTGDPAVELLQSAAAKYQIAH
jgi:tetratricopeptide (TPR) repeat protein